MSKTPNILWIVADHQIHASRPTGFTDFPLQKKLAEIGTEFSRAYSVLPICSPARASMLTGLYPHAHGLTENDGRFGGREGLDPADWMIHHPLRDAGYRCGWFGKWHVDNQRSAQDYGFEGYSLPGYGYPYGCDAYGDYLKRKSLVDPVATIAIGNESGQPIGTEIKIRENAEWFDPVSGVLTLGDSEEAHEAFFVVDLATQWIDSLQDEKFFVRVDPWGPHPPYLLADPYYGMLDDLPIELPKNFHSALEQRPDHHRSYRDFWRSAVNLNEEDWLKQYQHALEHCILVETALCRLLDHVDLSNTIVIFNSDHGDAVSSNGGIANKGDSMAEATMKIPLVMAGQDIAAGNVQDELVSNLDLGPTVLDLCGINGELDLHGMSMLPSLSSKDETTQDGSSSRGIMSQHYGLQEPIVQRAWYWENFKFVVGQDGFRELYDLASDPEELENLALNSGFIEEQKIMEQGLRQEMQLAGDDNDKILRALTL